MVILESDFTQPTDECLHPWMWHAYDSDSAEVEVIGLLAALVVALQPEFVVETGTAFGHTAQAIGEALAQNGHGRLLTIEIDAARCAIARDRCDGLPVEVWNGSSLDFVAHDPIDFVLFDSLFELRRVEYDLYRRWFSPRAVVAFHDTGTQHPLRESLAGLPLTYLPTPRGLAIGRP